MNEIASQAKNQSQANPLLAAGILQRKCACGNPTVGGEECAKCMGKKSGLQRKLTIGASNDPLEREADRVADQVMAKPAHFAVGRAPLGIQRYFGQSNDEQMETAPAAIVGQALASPGMPLEPALRQDMEQRFGHDFSRVRVHTGSKAAESTQAVNALAYTIGRDVVLRDENWATGSSEGKGLLAHELTHVIQQGNAFAVTEAPVVGISKISAPIIQKANAADPRLPLDQAEAISYAAVAKTEIDSANTRLAAAADPRQRNVPTFIAQQGITLAALTPRHDSAAPSGRINFFAGQVDYSDSIELPERATHHINAARNAARIRARQRANVDNPLSGRKIEERLVQAVSEIAYTAAARSGAPNQFDLYRAQFNAFWNREPSSAAIDVTLSSKGPRTPKSRAIFDRIYADNAAVKAAYDANAAGIRERIDAYVGPEGLNPINSPRLQTLRAAFFPVPAPVPNNSFPAFRTAIRNAAAALEQADRDVVDSSNDWQRLINQHVTTEAKRAEIRNIIRTPPPPPAVAPAPALAPAAGPAAAPGSGAVTSQMFLDGVRIDGPAPLVVANQRRERVTLTPRSNVANPNVAIDSRFTITPITRVQDSNNISPASTWPDGAAAGTAFAPEIINTSTVDMTAHLELINGRAGLAPSTPIPDLTFRVQDNRQSNFIANWFAAVKFNSGAGQALFVLGTSKPHYRGGTQNFNAGGFLPPPQTNPGLTLFVKARLKRGATVVAEPSTLEPFPPDASQTTRIPINIPAPAVVPVGGDNLDFEVELIGADRTTVLNMQTISMNVGPEAIYTQAQAIAEATADDTHFHDNSPTGLLGQMTALGGAPATVAAAINAAPPAPGLTLRPLTVRHDSAVYVAAVSGGPKPSRVGYFVGTTYNDTPPDTTHSFNGAAGAAAFFLPDGFGPRFVVANRTIDVATAAKRSDASLITLIVHEAVHAMDVRPGANTPIEKYKTEFRAYWMDGRFGPPDQDCPLFWFTTACPPAGARCYDTAYRSKLPPPGPKSCRARAIFSQLYGSTTYRFVKPAYDNNTGGFRDSVDSYLIPDGINLIVSMRLEALRQLISAFTGGGFATFRTSVQGFMGIGAPPTVGALSADERNEVQRNRAWRDLVNSEVANAANRALIKADLGIPT